MEISIQTFNNPMFGEIRTTVTEDSEVLFKANDVAIALGYKNYKWAITQHCKRVRILRTPSENQYGTIVEQSTKFIPESEVYRLVMRSKLPEAEKFQDWVCEEILPSFRKHGAYMTTATIESVIADPGNMIKLLQALQEEREAKLRAQAKIEADAPKVLMAEALDGTDDTISVEELAKVLNQNGVVIGRNRLFRYLVDNKYIAKSSHLPTQKAMDMGLFKFDYSEGYDKYGGAHYNLNLRVTTKGVSHFTNKMIKAK